MEATQEQMLSILELILPKEILEHFIVTNIMIQPKEVLCIWMREIKSRINIRMRNCYPKDFIRKLLFRTFR